MTHPKKPFEGDKLEGLKALRGKHDQTIRCGVIEILYGPRDSMETRRFLEDQIRRLEEDKFHHVEQRPWQPGASEDGKEL
jgi:hypothetical protein